MSLAGRLSFGFRRTLPVILQTEATECGLACIAMVAGFHGYHADLASLRRRFSVSLKGATLGNLIGIAGKLDLATRPLKLDLDHLEQLRLPCILHWELNHFVVLQEVGSKSVTIHDPACGLRVHSLDTVAKAFTGVALELWPGQAFQKMERPPTVRLRSLMGRITGLYRSFGQILLFSSALEVCALVSPFYLQWVIDNGLVSADRDLLTTLALGFGILMLMQQAINIGRNWVLMYISTTLNVQWQANVFTHLLRLPLEYFQKRHIGDVVSRFGSVGIIQHTLTTTFLESVLDGAMAAITLALMLVYSPLLASIAVAAMALYGLGRWVWFAPLQHATEEQIVHAARQQSNFLETVRGIKTIKLFQRQDDRRSGWLCMLVDQVNAELRTQKLGLLYRSLNGLLFGLENILIVWLGARLVIDGNFSVGVFIAFNAYKAQFDSRVSGLIDKHVEVKMLRLQGERLADIVMHPPEEAMGAHSDGAGDVATPCLEVRDLRFRFAEHEPYVLDGVSLKINPGEAVAIVGPSGGGKTTLINILLGILSPTEGEVLIGGKSIRQAGLETIRKTVGTVLQDDVLFAGSIADNISFFDPQADASWIRHCAGLAAIHQDIAAMPMGYNTLVGDMGTVLSGGQKQRVLLARALYKKPGILFLDEATSHLDIERERLVNQSIASLHLTRVIVAHRPDTINSADRVLVLKGGKIIQDVQIEKTAPPPGAKAQEVET